MTGCDVKFVLVLTKELCGNKSKKYRSSNAFDRNERVMYYACVLLKFQNPTSPIYPINHGYQILNGICMPIMHSKSPLPDVSW